MEGSIAPPPPTPATTCAPAASSPRRSPSPSSDAADGASVPPTPMVSPQDPERLFNSPHSDHQGKHRIDCRPGCHLRPPLRLPTSWSASFYYALSTSRPVLPVSLNLPSSFMGAYRTYLSFIWRALLCLEGLMSMRVFACGGPVPHPLSPLPGCA